MSTADTTAPTIGTTFIARMLSRASDYPRLIVLKISELYQRFGERIAVDKLSLTVGKGELVGLVGRNGAGKTTTMRAVMGILQPLGGSITWSGHPVGLSDRLRFGY
ncbi:MAG TPA: ATP-binding cassette domain-containing protein, partial [Solirubrobacterales bacterium]